MGSNASDGFGGLFPQVQKKKRAFTSPSLHSYSIKQPALCLTVKHFYTAASKT